MKTQQVSFLSTVWLCCMEKVRAVELAIGAMVAAIFSLFFAPVAMITQAHASIPAEVSDAISEAGVDGRALAFLVLVAIVTIIAVKYMRRGL